MSDEYQALKEVASHPAAGGSLLAMALGFLANKVWRGHRHEVANMKSVSTNNTASIVKLDDKLEAHIQRDHDTHAQLLQQMADNHKEVLDHLINLKR